MSAIYQPGAAAPSAPKGEQSTWGRITGNPVFPIALNVVLFAVSWSEIGFSGSI